VAAPSFNPTSLEGLDLAVMLLSEPVQGVAPIELPTAGLLDQMKRSGELRDGTLTLVGYGADCTKTVPCPVGFDVSRRVATEAFGSLQQSTFSVLANGAATSLGGPCFGDSGSPHLLPGSMTTIGVTKAVLGNCNTAVPVTRVDTPEARSFLAGFVTVS
jgi:Trypsin